MHCKITSWLCLLSAATLTSAAVAAKRVPANSIVKRSTQYGWSLQSTTCPAGSNTCGNGACCPSGLFCNPAGNAEVAACCPTASDCRGEVEGAPRCADSSWSAWQGYMGNTFCCEVGLIGVWDYHNPVAGKCVAAADAVGATSALLKSLGSGGAAPTIPASPNPPAPTPTTTRILTPITNPPAPVSPTTTEDISPNPTPTTTPPPPEPVSPTATEDGPGSSPDPTPVSSAMPGATGKPIFFHYMIGTLTDAHVEKDIVDAKALGADAFALNIDTITQPYAIAAAASLFKSAEVHGFKLFFSLDMNNGLGSDPSAIVTFLQGYITNPSYFYYNERPLVSTFNGGSFDWKVNIQQPMADAGHPIYFVPAFQDVTPSDDFFTKFPTVDGAMNWNSWPFETQGKIVVPTIDDETYLKGARAAGKTFLMGVSPLQFKHIDSGNWYLRGAQNLEFRFGQVLNLQPDFIELQTWNDAGESHYMGNIWPEPISTTTISTYTDGYDHTGYKEILPAFFKAFKAGVTTTDTMYPTNGNKAQGTFWHHTLLAGSDCSADGMGKPRGYANIDDTVTAVVLVAEGVTSYSVTISAGDKTLGTQKLVPGFNAYSAPLSTGSVSVSVTDTATNTVVIKGAGPIAVTDTASLCNYNYQVVGLA